jgi:dihydrolipoamide dehydrogenase
LVDVAIIGGGPGGYAAALYARNFDLEVALIEKDRPGGTCLIRGCIPAKQWLHIAEVYTTVAEAAEYGVVTSEPKLDWAAALAKKNKTVDGVVRGLSGLLKSRGIEVIQGTGRLASPNRVDVALAEGGTRTVEASKVILATGSHARTIPGYEIDGEKIVTSDHALDWTSQPRRVGIIGGGVIGCEFASLLADVGSEVHVFEMMDQIIPGADPESARVLQRLLGRRGVQFHLGVGVGPVEKTATGVIVPAGDERVEVDVVLVAVGRGPNTEGIGLENTKVQVDRGYVVTDRTTMETDEPGVYAVGDIVAGTPQLAHVGFAEGIAAVTHLATGETAPVNYDAIPRVTYTHPELAEVGIGEEEAARRGIEVVTTKHFFNGVGRAVIIGQNQGHVKIFAQKDGPIVGASIVGPQAGEMIHELMYVVGWEALPSEAAAMIHAHPTLSEAIGETLMSAAGRPLH